MPRSSPASPATPRTRRSFRDLLANFSQFARDAVYPYGAGGPNASFALITDAYMRATGATREDFGKLCVAQRANARRNPLALLQGELTMEQYLAARPIATPLHLFDCVMPCAGADGFLVMSVARARALGLKFARVLGAIERHNAFPDDPVQLRGGWAMDRDALWAQAGIGPEDVDVVETYDDYPVISMLQFEGLGFCAEGGAPEFVRRHGFTIDGSFPHNTGGGQLSMGQAGAAGGYLGLVEAMRRVTRRRRAPRAGERVRDDQLRSRTVFRGLLAGGRMITLQRCVACGAVQYPPREICGVCLSDAVAWETAEFLPGRVLARTVLHHSNEPRFRARLPLAIGLVRLDAGPVAVCFLGEREPGDTVSVRARDDETGKPVLEAS